MDEIKALVKENYELNYRDLSTPKTYFAIAVLPKSRYKEQNLWLLCQVIFFK